MGSHGHGGLSGSPKVAASYAEPMGMVMPTGRDARSKFCPGEPGAGPSFPYLLIILPFLDDPATLSAGHPNQPTDHAVAHHQSGDSGGVRVAEIHLQTVLHPNRDASGAGHSGQSSAVAQQPSLTRVLIVGRPASAEGRGHPPPGRRGLGRPGPGQPVRLRP